MNTEKSKLLVVEDELVNREVLKAYLQKQGHEVISADDGEQAWQILSSSPTAFDVVVTDRIMPNLDGLALFERMKQAQTLKDIPVIMQTAANSNEEVIEGIEAGIYYYLTKPYQEDMLRTVIEAAILEKKQQHIIQEQLEKNRQALGNCNQASFTFSTLEEAKNISFFMGGLFKEAEKVTPGLYELMVNAVEHGNLGINYAEKSALIAENRLDDEMQKRLADPHFKHRKAEVAFKQDKEHVSVRISDEGSGFDWQPFMVLEPSRATDAHGRGIAKANLLSFDSVEYQGSGNVVQCTVKQAA